MGTVALYDVTGIQEYIFSSNKLAENLGASILVQKALDEFLLDSMRNSSGNVRLDWKSQGYGFLIKNESSIDIEVIYIGGGNAMVAFKDMPAAKKVTEKLSKKVLEETGGMLRFAVAYHDTGFNNFYEDRKELFKKLNKNKLEMLQTFPLLGIAITKEGVSDGLPAQKGYRDGNPVVDGRAREFVSLPAHLKREQAKKPYPPFDDLIRDYEGYTIPKELEDLGQKIGESHIAVVHIDGNNMGRMIEQINVEKEIDYETAVRKMRSLSRQITEKYGEIMKEVIGVIAESLEDPEVFSRLAIKEANLPLRPVVLNGDDVTFICNGKIGIPCAEKFLEKIGSMAGKINVAGREFQLSASAGVAIVKSHFPFYRAYQLAEALCHSAKVKGKIIASDTLDNPNCWMDYHIVFSGITDELNEMRKKHYQVPGMPALDDLSRTKYETVQMKSPKYHLLWRPWCMAGNVPPKYKWDELKKVYDEFVIAEDPVTGEKKWARSKLKDLRSQFIRSKKDVEFLVEELKSRGLPLPAFNGKSDAFRDDQTPYFDALEIIDFYLEL